MTNTMEPTVDQDVSVSLTTDETTAAASDSWKNAVFIIIGVIGMCSNGFVILVISKTPKMRKIYSNKFVMNQSVIDFLASVFVLLNTTNKTNFNVLMSYEGFVGGLACRLWATGYPMWLTFVASTYNLVVISFERYLGVCQPVWHHNISMVYWRAFVWRSPGCQELLLKFSYPC